MTGDSLRVLETPRQDTLTLSGPSELTVTKSGYAWGADKHKIFTSFGYSAIGFMLRVAEYKPKIFGKMRVKCLTLVTSTPLVKHAAYTYCLLISVKLLLSYLQI